MIVLVLISVCMSSQYCYKNDVIDDTSSVTYDTPNGKMCRPDFGILKYNSTQCFNCTGLTYNDTILFFATFWDPPYFTVYKCGPGDYLITDCFFRIIK